MDIHTGTLTIDTLFVKTFDVCHTIKFETKDAHLLGNVCAQDIPVKTEL